MKQAAEVTEPGCGPPKPCITVSLTLGPRGPGEEGPVGWERLRGEEAEPWNLEGDLDRGAAAQGELAEAKGGGLQALETRHLVFFDTVVIFSACVRGLHALLLGKKGVSLEKGMPRSQAQPATRRFV